ncbi:MAG TPA: DUF2147 domain-containing protein, partial [Gammaproteobacteria bacterium]|nr:DUF2147 domain-containing protein [Gammaproteobacteria bacterium]
MRVIRFFSVLALSFAITSPVWADDADAVLGQWVTADGKARVEIVKDGDVYDGRIVWLKEPLYPTGDKDH